MNRAADEMFKQASDNKTIIQPFYCSETKHLMSVNASGVLVRGNGEKCSFQNENYRLCEI